MTSKIEQHFVCAIDKCNVVFKSNVCFVSMLSIYKPIANFSLSPMQNSLEKCERCLRLHGDYEHAREAVRRWIISAHQQFGVAQQLNQSHEDLLSKRQLLKVDTAVLLICRCLA